MVPVEHPVREVVRLQRLDCRLCREARTREGREDAASRDGFRLARRVSDHEDVVRVGAAREPERDAACDVQDRLGALRVLSYFRPGQHLFQVCIRIPFADAESHPGRVAARDDPSEEARRDLVADEQRHESGVSSNAGHLHLEAGKDLPRSEDVEPLRHVRADAVAAERSNIARCTTTACVRWPSITSRRPEGEYSSAPWTDPMIVSLQSTYSKTRGVTRPPHWIGSPISRCSSTGATAYPAWATLAARYPPAGPAPITTTSKVRADVTTFRHHSFRFMMISRKFSRCLDKDALSV